MPSKKLSLYIFSMQEDSFHLLLSLGNLGYLHGRLKRGIKERIAALSTGHPSHGTQEKIRLVYAYCRATGERWLEHEEEMARSMFDYQYAMNVLKLPHTIARHWDGYMWWVSNGRQGRPAYSRASLAVFSIIDKYLGVTL